MDSDVIPASILSKAELMREDELRQLESGADELGIALSRTQKERFALYIQELLVWNQKVNLISKRDETRIVPRHILDSLAAIPHLPPAEGLSVLDVGAGAGFPGLPIKIVRDDLLLTLVESKRKKILFLRHVIERLQLAGTKAILGRAEALSSHSEAYDLVLSRGVARLGSLLRLSFPLLRTGGTLIAYKSGGVEEEASEAAPVLKEVGGGTVEIVNVSLPILAGDKNLILARKGPSEQMVN